MQDKKLTLQQYIECHNIKKQLRQRSKEKSRSKSRDRPGSSFSIPTNLHQISLLSPNSTTQNHKLSSHQILNSTIYDQVDYRARNLYNDLQQSINEIKLECRAIIKNDKDFTFFLKLMDALINKFRAAVMHIHRENLLLFQMSRQGDKTYSSDRDDLVRTHMQNLEKSFNQQYELSKSQYESNLNFLPNKTIKEKMQQNKKGEQMVKAIFGGLAEGPGSHKKILKKYDTEPKDQKERQERKQQAVSFLGFIMRNIATGKKTQLSQQQNLTLNPNSSSPNSNPFSNLNSREQNPKQYQKKQTTTTETPKFQVKNVKETNFDTKKKKQDDKIVKDINYLNSRPKTDINTDEIDKMYSDQNVSFQALHQPIKSIEKIKLSIPKSPIKNGQKGADKVLSVNGQKTPDKVITGRNGEKDGKRQGRIMEENKYIQRKRVVEGQPAMPPSANRIAMIKRTSSKSKGKVTNKVSATKKVS